VIDVFVVLAVATEWIGCVDGRTGQEIVLSRDRIGS
jgi:hypothetical protein